MRSSISNLYATCTYKETTSDPKRLARREADYLICTEKPVIQFVECALAVLLNIEKPYHDDNIQ